MSEAGAATKISRMAKKKSTPSRAASPASLGPQRASIYSNPTILPPAFASLMREVEEELDCPVFLLIQNDPPEDVFDSISPHVYKGFQQIAMSFPPGRVALLIDSPGGSPDHAFRLTRLFQRRCKELVVLVPQYAKSAATLISLGATELILGRDAEIGPLDLQIYDFHQERMESALNAVQALERLGAYALTAVDQTMQLLIRRLPKRTDVLLPFALEYVANLLRPLLEKVDTTEYARKSRDLKVAEEYAARLMRRRYGLEKSKGIARQLVQRYPAHGFVIDRDEAMADEAGDSENAFGLGLKIVEPAPDLQRLMDAMIPFLDTVTAIGRMEDAVR